MEGKGVCPTRSRLCLLLFLPAPLSAQPHPSCRAETQLPSQGGGWCSRQRCPLAPGNGDGAIGALMASPRSPGVRLATPSAWALQAWEAAASVRGHLQPPRAPGCPQLPAPLGGTSPSRCPLSVCLEVLDDRQPARCVAESLARPAREGSHGGGAGGGWVGRTLLRLGRRQQPLPCGLHPLAGVLRLILSHVRASVCTRACTA